jgi:hypothetical protein
MKMLKTILGLALIFSGLTACKKETAKQEDILINFVNRSGGEIKNARADHTVIGDIADNSQSGFIRFYSFGSDTGFPDCDYTAAWNNALLESSARFLWCGTEKIKLQPGKYNIEITLKTIGGKQYFHLLFK